MKVLVTGFKGQLGFDVVRSLKENNIEVIGVDRDEFDLTNEEATTSFIQNVHPNVIVHCAAYTAVDKAEEEKDLCFNINVMGTRYVASAAKEVGAKVIYISTDYVFDGKGEEPFKTTDIPNPNNYYGLTKYLGEKEVAALLSDYVILRISWAFGVNGHNFIRTMLNLSETRNELSVVSDQFGSPTYTYDLSFVIYDMIKNDVKGTYHVTNEGFTSWYEFACEIFKQANKNVQVHPILSKDYKTLASRPFNSRMEKNYPIKLRPWQEALKHYLKEIL